MSATGVLFDLDETLFDHEGASAEAVALWLEDRGIAVTDEILDRWFRSERLRFDEYVEGLVSFEQQRRNRMVDLLRAVDLPLPAELDDLDALFLEWIRLYERTWRAFPDARDAVLAVRHAGMRVGMLTNGLHQQQWSKVVRIGLADLFPEIVASGAIGVAKPNARAFMIACRTYGMDPAATVMVGDNHLADILGARAAGLRAIYVDRHGSGIEDPHRVDDLEGLPEVIAGLPSAEPALATHRTTRVVGLTAAGATGIRAPRPDLAGADPTVDPDTAIAPDTEGAS